jgi:uncharacterized C2H2 Zn-finger protein
MAALSRGNPLFYQDTLGLVDFRDQEVKQSTRKAKKTRNAMYGRGRKKVTCPLCDKSFARPSTLRRHVETIHEMDTDQPKPGILGRGRTNVTKFRGRGKKRTRKGDSLPFDMPDLDEEMDDKGINDTQKRNIMQRR